MYCDCLFCSENRFKINKQIGLAAENSVIYEDENIFITPDIAPLLCGHFLIITKMHTNSFGSANRSTYNSIERAKAFLRNQIFNGIELLFFEHGAVIDGTAGACIDHAHMHVIPYVFNKKVDIINEYINKSKFINSCKVSGNFDILQSFAKKRQPYIFYEMDTNNRWIYPVNRLPHQFFRMIISYYLSQQYNWKIIYKSDESKKIFTETLKLAEKTNELFYCKI